LELFNFLLELFTDLGNLLLHRFHNPRDLFVRLFIVHFDSSPMSRSKRIEYLFCYFFSFGNQHSTRVIISNTNDGSFSAQEIFELPSSGFMDDANLFILIDLKPLNLFFLNTLAAFVLDHPFPRENSNINHCSFHPWWHTQGGIAYLTGFLAKNCPEQF